MIRAEALFYTCRYRMEKAWILFAKFSSRFEHALLFYHQGLVCEAYITVWTPLITMTWHHDHDNEHDQCSWPGPSTWESGVQTRRGKMQENHLQHVASVDFSSDHLIIYTNPNFGSWKWNKGTLNTFPSEDVVNYTFLFQDWISIISINCKGKPLFEMYCFHMGIARKGGGWCKGLPGWFEAPFSHVCSGVKGLGRMVCQEGLARMDCQDGLPGWHFFSTFASLTEGGSLKQFGQCPNI